MYLLKEEQRYGRNKETTINHSYIEGGEYRKKFDRISDNPKLNKLLYQLAKKMLTHRSGTLYEDMYWIEEKSLHIVASETNCVLERKIVYSIATKKVIQRKSGLVTIHSHPNSSPPSLDDINSNYTHGYEMGIVCCHDGRLFKYWAGEVIPEESYSFYYQKHFKECRDEHEAQKRTWAELMGRYNIYYEEV